MKSKAEKYIEQNRVDRKNRPAFHVTAPVGWINDPNGFSVYQGQIHLFYQYHPFSTEWGPMHWGHCISYDMMKWEDLPVALAPDQEYDKLGCFSGSAIETKDGHLLVYTGVSEDINTKQEVQNQCFAIGDGIQYEKIKENPVVTGEMLPKGFDQKDFRDPKIWKEDDTFYLVAGNKDQQKYGQIVLFSSKNLQEWKYESVLVNSGGRIGIMWECPDFFALGDERILICSPQNMKARGYDIHNGHNSVYFTGEYNKEKHVFKHRKLQSLDYGFDFYAPQTTELPDGRRILIGWMQSWDNQAIPEDQKWQGMMTVPRELTLVNDELIQNPIKEVKKYYSNRVAYENKCISKPCMLEGIKGRILDMTIELQKGDFQYFRVELAHNEEYTTTFTYDAITEMIEADRTFSGICKDIVCQRKMKIIHPKDKLELRFILDRWSIELFVNGGEQVFSTAIYTEMEADQIVFSSDGNAVINVEKHDIKMEE